MEVPENLTEFHFANISEGITKVLNSSFARVELNNSLYKAQKPAEKLQSQQEILRVTNEELEEKTDKLQNMVIPPIVIYTVKNLSLSTDYYPYLEFGPMRNETPENMNKPKILIADYSKENLMALEELLGGLNVELISVLSGNEAVAKAIVTEFAIALIDVQIPDMDGFELLEQLRKNELTKNLPVIFITSTYRNKYAMYNGIESGAIDFLTKPIVPELLLGKIKIFLDLYEQKKHLSNMISERNQALNELCTYRDHLEELVCERTKEIKKINIGLQNEIAIRKKVEESLRQSEENFRLLTENSIDCIWTTDLKMRFNYVSPSIYFISGFRPSECIGKSFSSFTNRIYFFKIARLCLRVLKQPTIHPYEIIEAIIRTKNSAEIPIEITCKVLFNRDAKVIGLQGTIKDISERINSHKALIDSEIRFRTLYDNSPDMYISTTPNGTTINLCNRSLLCNLGYTQSEVIGKPVEELYHENSMNEITEINKRIAKSEKISGRELQLKRSNGDPLDVSLSVKAVRDKKNNILFYMYSWRDITERKRAEKQLKDKNEKIFMQIEEYQVLNQEYLLLNEDLNYSNIKLQNAIKELKSAKVKAEESDKLKSAFLANMSHEIRTPMNAIIGFSDLLKEEGLTQEKTKHYVTLINNSGEHLMQIISDILDISKLEVNQLKITPQPSNISTIISCSYEYFLQSEAYINKPNVKLELNIPKNLENIVIQTDPTRFKQIIDNLLNNALKYTHKGFIESGITVTENQMGKYIQIYVKDTGIGIPKEKKDIIFERFRQIEEGEFHEGAGLGLSISKGIVELLGGNIWFSSEVNLGTTFYFTVPFDTKLKTKNKIRDIRRNKLNLANKHIIVAEDDYSSFSYLKEILTETNVKIQHVHNGKELMDLIQTDIPDLILLDINMPVKTGYECLKDIREKKLNVKIIAQTAYAMLDEEIKLLSEGCNGYISKPFKKNEMFDTIENVLEL